MQSVSSRIWTRATITITPRAPLHYIYIHIYLYLYIVIQFQEFLFNTNNLPAIIWFLIKLATVVEGDPEAPLSIATTPRCREGRYPFPWIAPLYPWYVPSIAECQARRYQVQFLNSLVWRDLGLNPGPPDHWRTLYPQARWFLVNDNNPS